MMRARPGMDRAFSPLAFKQTGTWGCAPGWYGMGLWPARRNKAQVGDMGIASDCRFAARRIAASHSRAHLPRLRDGQCPQGRRGRTRAGGTLVPIQVKQKDKAGRPDMDAFETAMRRAKCEKGFFVSFDYTGDALSEISRFFKQTHRVIVPLTVREILDEQIAHKLV